LPKSGYGRACSAPRSSDSAATPGQQAPARAWAQFWAHSPPSATVRQWSPRWCSRSSRTAADAGERWPTLLESVLGATPQEFESPILRRADLQQHRWVATAKRAPWVQWAHLMGSFPQPWSLPPPISAAAVVLVRGITDGPERRSARRQGVCPTVQGWLGPFATVGCRQHTGSITLSNRDVPGECAPSRRSGRPEPAPSWAVMSPIAGNSARGSRFLLPSLARACKTAAVRSQACDQQQAQTDHAHSRRPRDRHI
jgi:hypothetical protein